MEKHNSDVKRHMRDCGSEALNKRKMKLHPPFINSFLSFLFCSVLSMQLPTLLYYYSSGGQNWDNLYLFWYLRFIKIRKRTMKCKTNFVSGRQERDGKGHKEEREKESKQTTRYGRNCELDQQSSHEEWKEHPHHLCSICGADPRGGSGQEPSACWDRTRTEDWL